MQFEQSLEKLNIIIKQLEDGQLSLEDTLKLYKEGSELITSCKTELETAKQVVKDFEAGEKHES